MASDTQTLIIDRDLCKGCGICIEFCPKSVLNLTNGKVNIEKKDLCIGCGMCEKLCPDYAIFLQNKRGK